MAARKQQQKAKQTRDELMAVAVRLFEGKGFAGTTVAEITRRAGYAKGSFYRHWRSKAELFLHIVEAKLGAHRERRDARIGEAVGLDEAMGVIWDFLEGIMEDRNWSRNMLEFTVLAARDEGLRSELARSSNRLSNEVFASLVEKHLETDYPAHKLGAPEHGPVRGVPHPFRPGHRRPGRERRAPGGPGPGQEQRPGPGRP